MAIRKIPPATAMGLLGFGNFNGVIIMPKRYYNEFFERRPDLRNKISLGEKFDQNFYIQENV